MILSERKAKMKTLTRNLLLATLAVLPLSFASKMIANEASPSIMRSNYEEATWLAFQLAKQAESLSYQDPYDRPGDIYDDYGYHPEPRRPRHDPEELIYAAQQLQQAAMDLYYTLRFLGRAGGVGTNPQVFRHFRRVKDTYRRLSFVAPYWKITHISNTYNRLENALLGYGHRW